MDPRTHHKRIQTEHLNKQHRNAVLQRLGIAHLKHALHPDSDDSSDEGGGSSTKYTTRVPQHTNTYSREGGGGDSAEFAASGGAASTSAGAGAASIKKKSKKFPTVLSSHLAETHAHIRQFYELISAWTAGGGVVMGKNSRSSYSNDAEDDAAGAKDVGEVASRIVEETIAFAPEGARMTPILVDGEGREEGDGRTDPSLAGFTPASIHASSRAGSARPRGLSNHQAQRQQRASRTQQQQYSPPFPFALEWLRTLIGGSVVAAGSMGGSGRSASPSPREDGGHGPASPLESMSESEAQKVLREQIARSCKGQRQEAVMCDTNDYGALRESILSYLGLIFFAVNGALVGSGGGSRSSLGGRRGGGAQQASTTFLTTPTPTLYGGGGDESGGDSVDNGANEAEGMLDGSVESTILFGGNTNANRRVGSAKQRSHRPFSLSSPSSNAASPSREEAALALQARLAAKASAAAATSAVKTAPPKPPLINMNIARTVCRPGSASASIGAGGGGHSPRDHGVTTAMDQLKRAKVLRDNIIPILTMAAAAAASGGGTPNHAAARLEGGEGEEEGQYAGDPDETRGPEGDVTAKRTGSPPKSPTQRSSPHRHVYDKFSALEVEKEKNYRRRLSLGGLSTNEGDAMLSALRYGAGSALSSIDANGEHRGGGVAAQPSPRTSLRPASSSSASARPLLSHRPRPPTASVEVASARIKVVDNIDASRRKPSVDRTNVITTHAVANAHGITIIPHDTTTVGSKRGGGGSAVTSAPSSSALVVAPSSSYSPALVHEHADLVLVSAGKYPLGGGGGGGSNDGAEGVIGEGPSLVGGEWGVGHSTWSPRNDARWVEKRTRPVSMRHGRR